MTIRSRFFSDGTLYYQDDFALLTKDTTGNGFYPGVGDELEVIAQDPPIMAVSVKSGRAYLRGYTVDITGTPEQAVIQAADPQNPRIDRVILRLSETTNRNITLAVLKGTPAENPVAPALTQTGDTYEISLAQIRVNAGVTSIIAGNITDERTQMFIPESILPHASTTTSGIVKVGSGLNVDAEGKLNVAANIVVTPLFLTSGMAVATAPVTPSDTAHHTVQHYVLPTQTPAYQRVGTFTVSVGEVTETIKPRFVELNTAGGIPQKGGQVTIYASMSWDTYSGSSANFNGYTYGRVVRATTGEVLGSVSVFTIKSEPNKTASGTITLPADFSDGETLYLEGYSTYMKTADFGSNPTLQNHYIYLAAKNCTLYA